MKNADTVDNIGTGARSSEVKIHGGEPLRVLFIGNSLTYYNSMPDIVGKLGTLAGRKIEVASATKGSGTMCQQISDSTEVGRQVRDLLKEKWDYVVIQPSRRITEKDDTVRQAEFAAGKILDAMIKNAGAQTLIYCTWGNNTGKSKIFEMLPDGVGSKATDSFPITQDDHSSYMQSVCREYCGVLGAEMVDCAELFRYLMKNQKAYNVYYTDDRHPSLYGSFAVACAFYSYFYGESAAVPAAKYEGIDPAGAAGILAEAAAHVVLGAEKPRRHAPDF